VTLALVFDPHCILLGLSWSREWVAYDRSGLRVASAGRHNLAGAEPAREWTVEVWCLCWCLRLRWARRASKKGA
jgi:hypothetical protein